MEDDLARAVQASKLFTRVPRKYEVIHLIDDPDAPPSTPKREEHWRTERRAVGKGGQGQVFLQTCISGGRFHTRRAVKKIPLVQGAGGQKRYMRELSAITRFSHANYSRHFVQSLGWYETKRSLCITMEYLEEGDLHTYLHSIADPMSERDSRHIIRQVLQSLAVMHDEGFTHGDIKPRNVLIKQRAAEGEPHTWWVKLADFGISKRAKEVTGVTTLVGTPEYMAPEMPRGMAPGDLPAADIWAVGVMTFHMLTRQAAFQSSWLAGQYRDRPDELFPRAALEECNVSADGQGFIRNLMAPMPEQRPSSLQALEERWVQIGTVETQQTETNYDSDLSDTSSTVSSVASARSDERGLTTQPSSTSDSTAMMPTRAKLAQTESFANLLEQQVEKFVGAETKASEESAADPIKDVQSPATSLGVDLNWLESEALTEKQKQSKSLTDAAKTCKNTEVVDGDDTAVPAARPESRAMAEVDGTINAAIKGEERWVMVMPTTPGERETAQMTYGYIPPLSKACQEGDWKAVEEMLTNGADKEERAWNGQTALAFAAEGGHLFIANLLVRSGAIVDSTSDDGRTPLLWAAAHPEPDTVDMLLREGANVEHRSRLGQTPLSWAATNGRVNTMMILLKKGADVEARSNDGKSPLSWAAMYGQNEAVQLLVDRGADVDSQSNNMHTPLLWSMEKGHESTTNLLLKLGAKLDSEKRLGTSSIWRALEEGNSLTLIKLLEKFPDMIEERNQIGQTPLGWAAERSDDSLVGRLLRRGANVEARSNNGQTPFSRAVTYGSWSTAMLLLQNRADIEARSYNGQTPLSWAAMYGRTAVVRNLLLRGAKTDTRSRNGQTPLDWAMEKGHDGIVSMLEEVKQVTSREHSPPQRAALEEGFPGTGLPVHSSQA